MLRNTLKCVIKTPQPKITGVTNIRKVNNVTQDGTHIDYKVSDRTESEVHHHNKLAEQWWDLNGPMKGLHALNTIRVPFIRDGLLARSGKPCTNLNTAKVLKDQTVLEVGCGAGILTEQLGRLGAKITGIDLGNDLICTARKHVNEESRDVIDNVTYKIVPVEVYAKNNSNCYDAVVASEVIEHIDDKVAFLTACVQCLKPGGSIFITTLNKTMSMWIGGVIIAEYIFKAVPQGIHHWDLLISPLDLQRILDTLGCHTVMVNGSIYNPFTNTWHWNNTTNFCYALQAIKTEIS